MDLERQVHMVWDPAVQPLVVEAWRCYSAGAIRASIGMTWVAVCADLTAKFLRLAEDGEGHAKAFAEKVDKARSAGLTANGVSTMQEMERTIITTAVDLELIDTIGARELERIREDRNLCVHPSLRRLGETYVPHADVARAHLAVALDTLLTHPPTQGRRLVDAFQLYVADATYVPSPAHMLTTFFERVHATTRRNIIQVAAKDALLELDCPPAISKRELADRMGQCLRTFASRDHEAVAEALRKLKDRFQSADNKSTVNALGRLGTLPEFWEIVDSGQTDRLNSILPALNGTGQAVWTFPAAPAVLALVAEPIARQRLPQLKPTFEALTLWQRHLVMAARPHPFFTPLVPELIASALSFRGAEEVTAAAVIPHGAFLTLDQLKQTLKAWAGNNQCREASGMPELALALFRSTAHLRPRDLDTWRVFIIDVRSHLTGDPSQADYESFYSYPDLETAVNLASD